MQPCHTEPEARDQRTYSEMGCNLGVHWEICFFFWGSRNDSIKGFLACFDNDYIECETLALA